VTANVLAMGVLLLGLIVGVARLWRTRADVPTARLALAALAGIVLSAPFVPPIDADAMRAYAVTLPFILFIVAAAVGQRQASQVRPEAGPLLAAGVSAVLMLLKVLGPKLARGTSSAEPVPAATRCASDGRAYAFQTHPSLMVRVIARDQALPAFPYPSSTVQSGSLEDDPEAPPGAAKLSDVAAGNTAGLGREVGSDRIRFFSAPTAAMPATIGTVVGCGPAQPTARIVTLEPLRASTER